MGVQGVHCCADTASLLSPKQHYVWALNLLTIQSYHGIMFV
jgi:hypothetical protein